MGSTTTLAQCQGKDNCFWNPESYKKTTKRINKGYKLCMGMERMMEKRAKIEHTYALRMESWSNKCRNAYDSDYGTMKSVWECLISEANQTVEIHQKKTTNLRKDTCHRVNNFRKGFYHTNFSGIKERNRMENEFKRVQNPYVKCLDQIDRAKKKYYQSCKDAGIVMKQVRYTFNENPNVNQMQIKKMRQFMEKSDAKVILCRTKYEDALENLEVYHPRYIADMTSVFLKCQELETVKLQFFKAFLIALHRTLNVTQNPNLAAGYDELYRAINKINPEEHLKWWSKYRGIEMKMDMPRLIDCSELYAGETIEDIVEETVSITEISEPEDRDEKIDNKNQFENRAEVISLSEENIITQEESTREAIDSQEVVDIEVHIPSRISSQISSETSDTDERGQLDNRNSQIYASTETIYYDCIDSDDFLFPEAKQKSTDEEHQAQNQ